MQSSQSSQNPQSFFIDTFGSWLKVAQKHNEAPVVSHIRRAALQSFKNSQKELDVNKLPPGLNVKTIEHAQANYHAAFLVATCDLQNLVDNWHKENTAEQRSALLLAVISAKHIDDATLYKFMISVGIKIDGGWFKYGGKNTETYNAFVSCHKCTPEELYSRHEGTVTALQPTVSKAEQHAATTTTTATAIAIPTATTTTTTTPAAITKTAPVQAAVPAAPVKTAEPKIKSLLELISSIEISEEEQQVLHCLTKKYISLYSSCKGLMLQAKKKESIELISTLIPKVLSFKDPNFHMNELDVKMRQAIMGYLLLSDKSPFSQRVRCLDPFLSVQFKPLGYQCHVERGIPFSETEVAGGKEETAEESIASFLKGGKEAQLINLALLFDEYLSPQLVEKVAALRNAIIEKNANVAGKAYFYQTISSQELLTMQLQKQFFIPSFMKGYGSMLDLKDPNCPVQKLEKDTKHGHPFNVVFEVDLPKGTPWAMVNKNDEQGSHECLLPCFSQFKFMEKKEENGLIIFRLQAVNDEPFSPIYFGPLFETWTEKKGELSYSAQIEIGVLIINHKNLLESYERNKKNQPQLFEGEMPKAAAKLFEQRIEELATLLKADKGMTPVTLVSAEALIGELCAVLPMIRSDAGNAKSIAQLNPLIVQFNQLLATHYQMSGNADEHLQQYLDQCIHRIAISPEITKLFMMELFAHREEEKPKPPIELIKLLWLSVPADASGTGFDEHVGELLKVFGSASGNISFSNEDKYTKEDVMKELQLASQADIPARLRELLKAFRDQ